jgi:DNA-binding transcriptional LysR family regulator
LERELGETLLIRNSRQVALTEAGRALLPAAYRAIAAAEEGYAAVAAMQGLVGGRLSIGVIQSLGIVNLPLLLGQFHQRHPSVSMRLRHDSVDALVRATVDGDLDLSIVDRPLAVRSVRELHLGSESLVLAVRHEDQLAGRRHVRLVDLTDREFVEYRTDSGLRALIDAACAQVGLQRRICCEVDLLTQLVALVEHGLGIALLPAQALAGAQGIVAVQTEPVIPRELIVVTAVNRPLARAAAALLDMFPTVEARGTTS